MPDPIILEELVTGQMKLTSIVNMTCSICRAGHPQVLIPVPAMHLASGKVNRNDLVCLGCMDDATPEEAQGG